MLNFGERARYQSMERGPADTKLRKLCLEPGLIAVGTSLERNDAAFGHGSAKIACDGQVNRQILDLAQEPRSLLGVARSQ